MRIQVKALTHFMIPGYDNDLGVFNKDVFLVPRPKDRIEIKDSEYVVENVKWIMDGGDEGPDLTLYCSPLDED